jgi:hypothetical protein
MVMDVDDPNVSVSSSGDNWELHRRGGRQGRGSGSSRLPANGIDDRHIRPPQERAGLGVTFLEPNVDVQGGRVFRGEASV